MVMDTPSVVRHFPGTSLEPVDDGRIGSAGIRDRNQTIGNKSFWVHSHTALKELDENSNIERVVIHADVYMHASKCYVDEADQYFDAIALSLGSTSEFPLLNAIELRVEPGASADYVNLGYESGYQSEFEHHFYKWGIVKKWINKIQRIIENRPGGNIVDVTILIDMNNEENNFIYSSYDGHGHICLPIFDIEMMMRSRDDFLLYQEAFSTILRHTPNVSITIAGEGTGFLVGSLGTACEGLIDSGLVDSTQVQELKMDLWGSKFGRGSGDCPENWLYWGDDINSIIRYCCGRVRFSLRIPPTMFGKDFQNTIGTLLCSKAGLDIKSSKDGLLLVQEKHADASPEQIIVDGISLKSINTDPNGKTSGLNLSSNKQEDWDTPWDQRSWSDLSHEVHPDHQLTLKAHQSFIHGKKAKINRVVVNSSFSLVNDQVPIFLNGTSSTANSVITLVVGQFIIFSLDRLLYEIMRSNDHNKNFRTIVFDLREEWRPLEEWRVHPGGGEWMGRMLELIEQNSQSLRAVIAIYCPPGDSYDSSDDRHYSRKPWQHCDLPSTWNPKHHAWSDDLPYSPFFEPSSSEANAITSLHLEGVRLSDNCVEILLKAASLRTIQTLSLAHNQLSDCTIIQFASMYNGCPDQALKELNLEGNLIEFSLSPQNMTDKKLTTLFKNVVHLNLSYNPIGRAGVNNLVEIFRGEHRLETLDIAVYYHGNIEVNMLSQLLLSNERLERLDIRGRHVQGCPRQITTTLRKHKALTAILMWGQQVDAWITTLINSLFACDGGNFFSNPANCTITHVCTKNTERLLRSSNSRFMKLLKMLELNQQYGKRACVWQFRLFNEEGEWRSVDQEGEWSEWSKALVKKVEEFPDCKIVPDLLATYGINPQGPQDERETMALSCVYTLVRVMANELSMAAAEGGGAKNAKE